MAITGRNTNRRSCNSEKEEPADEALTVAEGNEITRGCWCVGDPQQMEQGHGA